MLKTIPAAALLVVPFSAAAERAKDTPDWYHIDTTPTGTEIYVRKVDIVAGRPEQTDARLWMKHDFSRNRTISAREAMILYSVNCPRQTYRKLSITAYSPDGSVDTWQPEGEVEYVIPETNMAYAVALLCVGPSDSNPAPLSGGDL